MAAVPAAAGEGPVLDQAFFARPTLMVARDLIGVTMRVAGPDHAVVAGRIVEAEAYLAEDDSASHARGGPTPRCAIMFGPPGYLYVYLIYGMHHCLNFVTEADGRAGAVLIRALEPVLGLEVMARRRGLERGTGKEHRLCSGPGRLGRACGVDLSWNGVPVAGDIDHDDHRPGPITLIGSADPGITVATTPRIGVTRAADAPYRFIAVGHPCLSR